MSINESDRRLIDSPAELDSHMHAMIQRVWENGIQDKNLRNWMYSLQVKRHPMVWSSCRTCIPVNTSNSATSNGVFYHVFVRYCCLIAWFSSAKRQTKTNRWHLSVKLGLVFLSDYILIGKITI
ncbi:hypothetical protein BC833DRAFT_660701 [Globomyces pollinis-pini]|nr:hypothetical protein BC833DRAFT_660701 [Globomyces pollinis-pini]